MPDAPARVALIGVSGYARIHLEFLEELGAAGLITLAAVTVVNPDEERATVDRLRARGCEVYHDFRTMLAAHAGQLDLCCIPTGIPLHTVMTVAALEAGSHVLVEKPLAPRLDDVAAIQAAELRAGRWVAVGFQDIYLAQNQALQRQLIEGVLGRVQRIAVRGLWPRDSSYYTRNAWAGRISANGQAIYDSPLSNAFSHFVILALYLASPHAGMATSATGVQGWLARAQPIENFDTAAIRVTTLAGVELLIYLSHTTATELEPEIVIEGTAGRASWHSNREIRIEPSGASQIVMPLPDAQMVRRSMFEHVVARLSRPATFICNTALAAEHTRLCEWVQSLPIDTIPPSRIRHTPSPQGHDCRSIDGLEEAFASAWTKRQLLGELSPPYDPQSFCPLSSSGPDRRISAPA
jgi:predicted dehydrogenase